MHVIKGVVVSCIFIHIGTKGFVISFTRWMALNLLFLHVGSVNVVWNPSYLDDKNFLMHYDVDRHKCFVCVDDTTHDLSFFNESISFLFSSLL